jgi:hypothetical protein
MDAGAKEGAAVGQGVGGRIANIKFAIANCQFAIGIDSPLTTMTARSCKQRLGALGLTVAVVAAIVALESLFFRGELVRLASPSPVDVLRVEVGNEGRSAAVMLSVVRADDPRRQVAGVFDLAASPPRLEILQTASPARKIVLAPHGACGFLTTLSGDLYAFDLAGDLRNPAYLGSHHQPGPPVLESSGDGSQVVMGCDGVLCWDRAMERCLWRRDDLSASSARFLPDGTRLVVSLYSGEVLVLDAATGQTRAELYRASSTAIDLAVSPKGEWLAALHGHNTCFVIELCSGRKAWSARYDSTAVKIRFSPRGGQLILANPRPGVDLEIVATASGEVQREISDWEDEVEALSEAPGGAVLVWSKRGAAFVARDLDTRRVVHELHPAQSLYSASGQADQ